MGTKILVCILLSATILCGQSTEVQVRLVEEESHPFFGSLRLSGLDSTLIQRIPEWGKVCRIDYEPPQQTGKPAMLGAFFTDHQAVYFTPRFPFVQGHTYTVTLSKPLPDRTMEFTIPVLHIAEAPEVIAIYPSSAEWPANQLKFYVVFSQPMRIGQALERIRLEDEAGNQVEAPFLDIGQELWDPGRQRLTVWFDPGRIKSLLIPNREKGPPLAPNRAYRLVVGADWQATNGRFLGRDFVKRLTTTAKDTLKPHPAEWLISAPTALTADPLRVEFGYSMDYAMLIDGIALFGPDGQQAKGRVETGTEESEWRFTPEKPWARGKYSLRFSPDLEDLAGNNLHRVFDAPPSGDRGQFPALYTVEFEIR